MVRFPYPMLAKTRQNYPFTIKAWVLYSTISHIVTKEIKLWKLLKRQKKNCFGKSNNYQVHIWLSYKTLSGI